MLLTEKISSARRAIKNTESVIERGRGIGNKEAQSNRNCEKKKKKTKKENNVHLHSKLMGWERLVDFEKKIGPLFVSSQGCS